MVSASQWRHRLTGIFTERLGLKFAALGFALILWLIVTSKEPTEEIVPVRLVLNFDSTKYEAPEMPEIHTLVAGEGKEIFALFTAPPVVRRDVPASEDSVTLTLRAGDVELPPNASVLVRDIQPRTIHVRLIPRGSSAARSDSGILNP